MFYIWNYVYKLALKCIFCFLSVDTITLKDEGGNDVSLTKTGIAWESDKKYKFQNPVVPEGMTLESCKETPTSYLYTALAPL